MSYYDNEVTPFDDINMTYDANYHGYSLTEDAIDRELNVSFAEMCGSSEEAKQRIKEFRHDFYSFVYNYNRRGINKRKTDEHRLAKDGDIRDGIFQAMLDIARASIRGGFNLDKDISVINEERGTVLDVRNTLTVPKSAFMTMKQYGMLHRGEYSYRITPDDYRSDY
jgi:hypothetical protein